MHNERLSDPFDPLAKQLKAISSKRAKTEEDLADMRRIEFEGGLYWKDDVGPVMPTYNIKRSFVEGGRINKLGKHVERGFVPFGIDSAKLEYNGPRTIDGLYGAGFTDVRSVKVGTSKVSRCRPKFVEWSCSFTADLDLNIMNHDDLVRVATKAGLMVGLGDFRQRYGRYSVEIN
jgi:hypothetical protein